MSGGLEAVMRDALAAFEVGLSRREARALAPIAARAAEAYWVGDEQVTRAARVRWEQDYLPDELERTWDSIGQDVRDYYCARVRVMLGALVQGDTMSERTDVVHVYCSQWASCGWGGLRRVVPSPLRGSGEQAVGEPFKPCPRCGKAVMS